MMSFVPHFRFDRLLPFSELPSSWQFQSCGRSTLHWCWPSQLKLLSYALPNSEPSLAFGPEHKDRIVLLHTIQIHLKNIHHGFTKKRNRLEVGAANTSRNECGWILWMFDVLFVGKFEKTWCFHIDSLYHSVPMSIFSWFSFRIFSASMALAVAAVASPSSFCNALCVVFSVPETWHRETNRFEDFWGLNFSKRRALADDCVSCSTYLFCTSCDSSSLSERCFKWLKFFFSSLIWICWSHVESICRVRTSSLCASRDLVSSHKAWTRLSMPQNACHSKLKS